MLTIVLGMAIGWAWGVCAMAAALQARSQTLLASQYTTAQSALVSGAAPDAQFQSFIFHGDFLDTRSTIVFAIFFFVGSYALAAMRAMAPKLTLASIFGTIVMVSHGVTTWVPDRQLTCLPLVRIDHLVHLRTAIPIPSIHARNTIPHPHCILHRDSIGGDHLDLPPNRQSFGDGWLRQGFPPAREWHHRATGQRPPD